LHQVHPLYLLHYIVHPVVLRPPLTQINKNDTTAAHNGDTPNPHAQHRYAAATVQAPTIQETA